MGLFGKSAKQKRIDELATENAWLTAENNEIRNDLTESRRQRGVVGRLADELLSERDAARIERDTAQRERDGYRPDAIKFRALKANLIPGGPKAKAKRDAARAVQELRA